MPWSAFTCTEARLLEEPRQARGWARSTATGLTDSLLQEATQPVAAGARRDMVPITCKHKPTGTSDRFYTDRKCAALCNLGTMARKFLHLGSNSQPGDQPQVRRRVFRVLLWHT
jgi:hypothetical protein